MTGFLLSRPIVAEYGEKIRAAAKAAGLEFDLLHPPEDGKERLSAEALARVEVGYLTRDLRFSPDHLRFFIDTMRTAPNVKWIHFVSSGISQYDQWLVPMIERGVRVSTSTGSNAEPVAQIGLLALLLLGRRAMRWYKAQPEHRWDQMVGKELPPDLEGRTIVVVGVGAVGRRVCEFARMLRMHVIGVRRSPKAEGDPVDEMHPPQRLAELLPRADYLALCCPLTAQTRRLIDAKAFELMKPSANLINLARGEVVDERAMIEALRAKRIAGAYLDVFETEPLPADSPLWDLPNAILSPHNASSSTGNAWRSCKFFIDNIGPFARGTPMTNEVVKGGPMPSD